MPKNYSVDNVKEPLNKLVVKRNDFVSMRTLFSAREHKLINLLISKVNRKLNAFEPIELGLSDIAEIITTKIENSNLKVARPNGRILTELKNIISDIRKKDIWLVKEDFKLQTLSFFHRVELDTKETKATFTFHEDLKPYLLNQEKSFTQYKLKYVITLKSKYSIVLYELLKRKLSTGKELISLDKLRYIIGLDEQIGERLKMPNYSDFEKNVIKKAQKELSEKTDIKFSYTTRNVGRKVEYITFFPKVNRQIKEENIELIATIESVPGKMPTINNEHKGKKTEYIDKLFSSLKIDRSERFSFYQIPKKGLSQEVKDYMQKKKYDFEDYLIEKLELTLNKISTINDAEAYLYKSITDNYKNKKVEKTKLQEQVRQESKKKKLEKRQIERRLAELQNEKANMISKNLIQQLENKESKHTLESVIKTYIDNDNSFVKDYFYNRADQNILKLFDMNNIAFAVITHHIETNHLNLLNINIPSKLIQEIKYLENLMEQ